MVYFVLRVKCNLDGIKTLYPSEDYTWTFKVKCLACGEESPKWHDVDIDSFYDLKLGKGAFNFVYKCKLCSRENSLDILKKSIKKINSEDCMEFRPLVTLDCRGLQPVDFAPGVGRIGPCAFYNQCILTVEDCVIRP